MKHLAALASSSVAVALIAVASGCAPVGGGMTTPRMTEDPCATAHDCGGCAAMPGCGWCAGSGECLSGNATTPVGGTCTRGWTTDRATCGGTTPQHAATVITGPSGSQLEIPAGAAATPAEFTITVRNPVTPALPSDLSARGPVFDFAPDGYTFAHPATVQVPFGGDRDGELTLYTVNAAGVWVPVDGAVLVNSTLRAPVTHLGLFVVAVPTNTWRDVTGALPTNQPVRDFAFVGTRALAATGRGVYRSDDDGATWVASSAGLPNSAAVYRFAQLDTQLFAATERGVYRSTDNGASWTAANTGLPTMGSNAVAVTALGVHHAQLFAGGEGFVMRSTDNGRTWAARQQSLPLRYAPYVLFSRGDTLFAGTYGAGLWSTNDDGASWIHADFGDESVYDMANQGDALFGATAMGVQQYTGGAICAVLDSGVPNRTPVVLTVATTSTRLYAALGGVGVHFSTDNGHTWTPSREGLPRAASGEFDEIRLLRGNGTAMYAVVNSGSTFQVYRGAVH